MIVYMDPITDRVKGDASEIKWVCGVAAQKGAGPMPTSSSPPVEVLPCSGEMLQKGARMENDIPKIGQSTGKRAGNRGLGRK